MPDFDQFGLSVPVLDAIAKMGFVEASPIQKKALPLVLEGRDLLGQAQTGTGKTAAFGIPMAQLLPVDDAAVQALVLCPTRELAVQVAEEIHEICLFSGHKVLPVYGGQRIDRQINALHKGVQIVVGTPGRILDHLGRRTLDLGDIKMLVLDEADMMLDMGFLPDIRRILRQCAQDRQTLLFSATIPDDIQRIARDYMRDPEFVSVTPDTLTLEDTEQIFYEVPEDEKIDALMRLLDYEEADSTAMIFCRTRRNVEKLARKLKARGYDVEGLHGDLTQQQRDRIMQDFRDNKFSYLVATDVAARGLDISHVTHVINFHIPQDPEAYVHRIGRTGRMGREGVAITFVTPAEYWDLLRIQEFSRATIEPGELPTIEEVEARRKASRGDEAAKERVKDADSVSSRKARSRIARGEAGEGPAFGEDEGIQTLWPTEDLVAEGDAEVVEAIAAVAPDVVEAGRVAEQRDLVVPAAVEAVEAGTAAPTAVDSGAGTMSEAVVAEEAPAAPERRTRAKVEPERLVTLPDFSTEGATEHERHARRHVLRDASKRIEWTEAEQAMREAARIERDILLDALQDEAAATTDEGAADTAARVAAEAALLAATEEADAARRLDLQARLEEAERQVAAEQQRRLEAGEPLAVAPRADAGMPAGDVGLSAEAPADVPKRRSSRRRKPAAEASVETPAAASSPDEHVAPAAGEPAAAEPAAAAPGLPRAFGAPAPPPLSEEERILRALELRDRARAIIAAADTQNLGAELAVLSRLEQESDLRVIAAALLRELGAPSAPAPGVVAEAPIVAQPAPQPSRARRDTGAEEAAVPSPPTEDEGDEMTRLFISIGRRARVTREKLQQLLTETAGIELDDIGRIDLLHNFAFIEVRKQVAGRVVESMHDTMFRGRGISVEPAKAREADEPGDDEGSSED